MPSTQNCTYYRAGRHQHVDGFVEGDRAAGAGPATGVLPAREVREIRGHHAQGVGLGLGIAHARQAEAVVGGDRRGAGAGQPGDRARQVIVQLHVRRDQAARGLLDPAGGHRLRQQRVAVLARGQPGRAARRHGPVHQRLQLQAGGIRLALGVGAQHARRREHQVRFGGRRRRVGHRAVPASGSIE